MSLRVNPFVNKVEKRDKLATVASMPFAGGAFGLAYEACGLAALPIEDCFDRANNLSEIETLRVNKALTKAFNNSGLKEKGVKFAFVPVVDGDYLDLVNSLQQSIKNPVNEVDRQILASFSVDFEDGIIDKAMAKLNEFLSKKAENSAFCKKLQSALFGDGIELFNLDNFVSLKAGENAFYTETTNYVFVPDKKINIAGFHEMGHAINDKMFKSTRLLQKMQGYCTYITGGLLVSALLAPDLDENKKENPFFNALSFVKKNIGKLAFLAYMPITLEEGLATINGNKLAKQVLNEDFYKRIKKANRLSFTTYLISALAVAAGAKGAVLTKDFAKKKLQKSFFAKENSCANSTENGEQNNI